ncbi:16S rRNA processing protein RimM [Wolbachia endosymbiont of Pentalonia nigronervosa]|jgi:16S rRNA processing protein RimM|uniref:ribosome maturation factor RimM n=1 Tax=Wolbachia endosymbiont of Pentalonia nigronervosa TaxID=1301914 RepID=UPI00165F3EC4|nr:ribosome maturation factor RimM [Wolbachia endosymbiont of Pentalonia nigronervosa]MBD0391148.1 16S rRNA processing protein RimM [Wolbachia endosymbiont of Pentalonia nigronervosa]
MDKDRLVCLGIITSPHGIKGAVKIKTFTEKPENISSYGELINGDESYKIDSISIAGDNLVIATLNGVNSRNKAELLRNKKLYTTQDKLPELDNETEFYHNDLIDMEVRLENESYGYVKFVHNFGSGDILEILVTSTKKNVMLPFTKEIFPHINVKKKYIVLSIPEFID